MTEKPYERTSARRNPALTFQPETLQLRFCMILLVQILLQVCPSNTAGLEPVKLLPEVGYIWSAVTAEPNEPRVSL